MGQVLRAVAPVPQQAKQTCWAERSAPTSRTPLTSLGSVSAYKSTPTPRYGLLTNAAFGAKDGALFMTHCTVVSCMYVCTKSMSEVHLLPCLEYYFAVGAAATQTWSLPFHSTAVTKYAPNQCLTDLSKYNIHPLHCLSGWMTSWKGISQGVCHLQWFHRCTRFACMAIQSS